MTISDPAMYAAADAGRAAASSSGSGWQRGQLVRSRAGRDKGKYYLVLAAADEKTLLLADGRKTPVKQPKRKNIRHLQFTRQVAADLSRKRQDEPVRDEEIRAAMAAMLTVKEGK
jgi:ribosomal protein L14E/L6E/L27E